MSKKANPTLVGTFVIIAIGLAIGLVLTVGNIKLNEKNFRCVLYFQGSLHGLDIGAPVTYRGVIIGQVADIRIAYDRQHQDFRIPVFIDISEQSGQGQPYYREAGFDNPEEFFLAMIKRGLWARLKMRSLLTGKLFIELAFAPWTQGHLVGDTQGGFQEIPTLPSGLEQLTQTLENLPVKELITKAMAAMDAITELASSSELQQIMTRLGTTLADIDQLVVHVDQQLQPLASDLQKAVGSLADLTANAEDFLEKTTDSLQPLAREMRQSLALINQTAEVTTAALHRLQSVLDPRSELHYQLQQSLRELQDTSRAIRRLSIYLERHPEALLRGRQEEP